MKEDLVSGVLGYAGTCVLLFLFYDDLWISSIFSIAGAVGMIFYQRKNRIKKQQWQLMTEFKDAMDSMVSALVAGYSMENAIYEAYQDLRLMYEEDSPMLKALQEIHQKNSMHEPLDKVLSEFAADSGVEDIRIFAQIYATARRSGGNLVKVMKRTADNIGEKIEIQGEIRTMIAGKRMESMCMMIIPIFIILYLRVCSPGFLDPVYEGLAGHMFMTVALIIYIISVFWSFSIMHMDY